MSELEGRVIAVAGACGGLGPTVTRRLADAGATLALTDVVADRLEDGRESLGLPDDRIDARVVDLLDPEAASEWAGALTQRFGRIDGLIHLVGGWRGGEPLATAPLSDYEWLHDVLVRTVINATRAFAEPLGASEHGRFVLVSSAQAQAPSGTNAAYAATKAAAETWTLALADTFRKDESKATANILVVNAILTPKMRADSPDKPFKTFTSTEDIADSIAFLCSDAGQKMNGKRLELHPL
jgi:NAD(P)-dependent dehydrogenase (short-subunit alcohol dehydrogenase family)